MRHLQFEIESELYVCLAFATVSWNSDRLLVGVTVY